MAYLDHDHREGEDVRFLAIFPLDQHLWRGPSHGQAVLARNTLYGVRVFGNLREAKIRDPYVARVFHKDVKLVGCRYGVKQESG